MFDPAIRNRVLLATRPDAQVFIAARLLTRPVEAGDVLFDQDAPLSHAIFPQLGVVSMMSHVEDGKSVEKVSVGNEGFLGLTYLMGGSSAVARTVVQVPGYASWLSIADLEEAMERFVCVREAMLNYAKALIIQLMETVACNGLHSAEQRVARWLLLADERMEGSAFTLTQDALGRALALRRATISNICSNLQKTDAITYVRGRVTVVDRHRLHDHACTCYDNIKAGMLPIVSARG